jgi:serine phosphatase RsbU (regulator of sigma subunit)
MASLVTVKGPVPGQTFALGPDTTSIGRQPDVDVYLESLAVSRQHARLLYDQGAWLIEDLGSSNGTWINGERINQRRTVTEQDAIQIGPYLLALRPDRPASLSDTNSCIRAQVDAVPSNQTLIGGNAAHKLQVVLEITQHLGHTLELDPLLNQLLDQLFRLFPQADRGLVMLCRGEELVIRAQRSRSADEVNTPAYSKTIVNRALADGVGLLSEDVGDDPTLKPSATMVSLRLRSFLCVPLIGWEQRRLGIIQLDSTRAGRSFSREDLELLTAIGLHVAVVLENAALHAEQLRQARLHQDLLLAREIQQAFLPGDFSPLREQGFDVFARVHPAREVSGDLYDFIHLADGRLAFFLGDVAGKGMPAALFMIAVRTLIRHLAREATSPADLIRQLNRALVADNPTSLFVTLAHGTFDPRNGSVVLALGGHPMPLLRRSSGRVEPLALAAGCLLGSPLLNLVVTDNRLTLAPGETLILYTDGFTEAFAPDKKTMFGLERLCKILGGPRTSLSLERCAEEVSAAVLAYTGGTELQDDQTLFMLRRPTPTAR